MSEHFPTTIFIGGNLPEGELDGLLEACAQQAVCWDDFSDMPDLTDYIVQECQGKVLELYHPAQTDGDFPIIRAFCEAHGLSYRQDTEPGPGRDGRVHYWTRSMAKPMVAPLSVDGHVLAPAMEVLEHLWKFSDEGVGRPGSNSMGRLELWLKNNFQIPPARESSVFVFNIIEDETPDEEDLGNCINCGTKLIAAYDVDPNGEMDCICARCQAEQEHDFDANPDVYHMRGGEMIDICEYHRDSMGWDACSDSFFQRGGNPKGCFVQRQRSKHNEEEVSVQAYINDRRDAGLTPP